MYYAVLNSRDTLSVRWSLLRYLILLEVTIKTEEDISVRLSLCMEYNDIVEILNRKFKTKLEKIR